MPQIRADHEHTVEALEVGDLQAETGECRVPFLSAKIQLPQAMVDIGAAQPARNLREQIQLFHRSHGRGQEPRRGSALRGRHFLQALGRGRERHFPVNGPQLTVDAHHGLRHPVRRVHAFEAEAVAVGDPGFVDLFVFARDHAHQLAAQHMCVQVGAESVVRRYQRLLCHFPGARVVTERFVVERADRA